MEILTMEIEREKDILAQVPEGDLIDGHWSKIEQIAYIAGLEHALYLVEEYNK